MPVQRGAIYARFSSENQRPESLEDQVRVCRTDAPRYPIKVLPKHIYTDAAMSGAIADRPGLQALLEAARQRLFDAVLVDDLSRLARDNTLLLMIIHQLQFHDVRVISVADGLDTADENDRLGIQFRGIFNELQLVDLRKKTWRGQKGQKERGYFSGEGTFGYSSVPGGEIRLDKHGRPRPEGYLKEIDPAEAAVVLRVYRDYAGGMSITGIVQSLNADRVPGRRRSSGGWSLGTISRMLSNTKYIGLWIWNKTGNRRDLLTGRCKSYAKPEEEWDVREFKHLRIVPQELWDQVAKRRAECRKVWPGGSKRGYQSARASRVTVFPTHLLCGAMVCGSCSANIGLVSGKGHGYYGCLAASRRSCDNRVRVPRRRVENIILAAVRERLLRPEALRHVFERVRVEIERLLSEVPDMLSGKVAQLDDARRRVTRIVDFIACGKVEASQALAATLVKTEALVDDLTVEVQALEHSRESVFRVPSLDWIRKRVSALREVLEQRTESSALLLRRLLGKIVLEPVHPATGRPYYVARTSLDALVLSEPSDPDPGMDSGANVLGWWRRRALHPRPESRFVRSSTLVAVLAGLAVESRRRRVPDRQRVSPRRGMLRHISARPALWMPPLSALRTQAARDARPRLSAVRRQAPYGRPAGPVRARPARAGGPRRLRRMASRACVTMVMPVGPR